MLLLYLGGGAVFGIAIIAVSVLPGTGPMAEGRSAAGLMLGGDPE